MTEEVEQIDDAAASAANGEEASSVEDAARRMGWRPKEEYRGDPEKWRPADEFVERGLNELPVLRDRYRKLDEKYAKDVGDLKNQVKEMGEVLSEFREFASKGEERAYQRAMRELVAKRDAAVMHADTETFKATQAEIDSLNDSVRQTVKEHKKEEVKQPAQTAQAVDPYVEQWVSENSWFTSSKMLKNAAVAFHTALLEDSPGLSLRENLAMVREEVMKRFPEKFENKRRSAPAAVSDGGSADTSRRGKGKGYNDLPPDAKAACDRFVKTIPGFTKDSYVKQYFGEDA